MTDGKIFTYAVGMRLNTSCDGLIMGDKVERFKIRRYYGPNAAYWDPLKDEEVRAMTLVEEHV